MLDRKWVIAQFTADIDIAKLTGESLVHITRKTAMDTLAILREQEAVEPKWASGIKGGADALCGSCREWLADRSWGYCPRCGKKVDWGAWR